MITYNFNLKKIKSLIMKNMQKSLSMLIFFIPCLVVLFAQERPLIIDKPGTFEILSRTDYPSSGCGFTIPGEGRLRIAHEIDPTPLWSRTGGALTRRPKEPPTGFAANGIQERLRRPAPGAGS